VRFPADRASLPDFNAEMPAIRYRFLAISILGCILEANTVNKRRKSRNKGKKFPAEPLTRDEVKALLKVCSNRAPTGIRNRTLIVLFYRCGLRVKEALSLMPKDCDTKQGTIRVLHGKGDKSRLVGLDPEAAAVLQRWLDRRIALGVNGRHPLFCTLNGKPVQSVYVRNLLKRLADKVGIEKRVHPHGLRHTHAYELANEGTPLHVIQHQLGHSSLATTDRYIRHLNPQQVVEAMRGRTWAG
jgi:site-specific recombinase XerD